MRLHALQPAPPPAEAPALPGQPASRAPRRSAAGAGRAALLPLLLLAALFALFFLHGLQKRAAAAPAVFLDPRDLDWDHLPEWADARWADELREGMEGLAVVTPDDAAGLALWEARLRSFSFVRDVPRFSARADGRVELALELRVPSACIPVADLFFAVADDGTVLSGAWSVPPRVRGRWLPVIGPLADAYGLFDRSLPGDFLVLDEHVAALDVALSMHAHLSSEEAERLGRIVIDATRVAELSVDEPGIRLLLEDRRLALFGRPPFADAPGELPPARKWGALVAALELLEPRGTRAALDFELVDLRWDRPGLVLRGEAAAAAGPQAGPALARAAGRAPQDPPAPARERGARGRVR